MALQWVAHDGCDDHHGHEFRYRDHHDRGRDWVNFHHGV
jgi:hypothetical protein